MTDYNVSYANGDLVLRGNTATRGLPAHILISDLEGGTVGRVFGTSVADAWEKAPAKVKEIVDRKQQSEVSAAVAVMDDADAEENAKAAALARINAGSAKADIAKESD